MLAHRLLAQQAGTYSRVVDNQQTVKSRGVARLRVGENPPAQSAHPYRRSPTGSKECAGNLLAKGEVFTILGGAPRGWE